MSTTEQTQHLENENLLLKQQVEQLNLSLNQSKADFDTLKYQNSQLIEANNKLVEQITLLTGEIKELKQQVIQQAKSNGTSSPASVKNLKRSSLPDLDESLKKIKTANWWEDCQKPTNRNNNDAATNANLASQKQHNLNPGDNDNAKTATHNVVTESNEQKSQEMNVDNNNEHDQNKDNENANVDIQIVSYKKPNQNRTQKKNNDTKIIKPAPIQVNVGDEGYLALHTSLNRVMGKGKFVAKHMRANQAVRIQAIDIETSKQIMQFLAEKQYQFHSFKNKTDRNKCFILRGLSEVKNTSLIYEALIQAGFPNETTITPHITGFQRANPEIKHNTLYRVVTPGSFDEKKMNEIDALFGFKIQFEKMKGNKVIQCKRCQGYFHTASSCHHPYKCFKCNENHEVGNCPRDIDPDLPIRCVNCNGSHSANNYKECKFFKEKIAPILYKKKGITKSKEASYKPKSTTTNQS